MPLTELIVNGGFDSAGANWSGNDIEAHNREFQFLGNGSQNRVAEMDGSNSSTSTTVMEQSFTVTNPTTTNLTLETALRTSSNPQAGLEGFRVEILDSTGTAIASSDFFPTANSLQPVSVPVTFPTSGTYTVRFTELGPSDGLGAIIDNISLLVCFAAGSQIQTPRGETSVEHIRVGDLITMHDRDPKPVQWIGSRQISTSELQSNPKLRPVRITAGALGIGLPKNDLLVSRQHRMLLQSRIAERMFGKFEVLLPAIRLLELPGIFIDESVKSIEYIHLLFDRHEIIYAEGAPTESLFTGPEALKAISPDAREEILTIFPELRLLDYAPKPARFIPSGKAQKQLITRHLKNNRPSIESEIAKRSQIF